MSTLPELYGKDSSGKIRVIKFYVKNNTFWSEYGIKGGNLIKGNPTICEGKNIGRSNETTPESQALLEARAKWQKKKDEGYFEDIKDVDNLEYFKPMLAAKWEDKKNHVLKQDTIFLQPKLDGIRCLARLEKGEVVCRTRKGKEIVPISYIRRELERLLDEGVTFDGELYSHELTFNEITSLVRKTKPSPADVKECSEKIEYHIYDCYVDHAPDLSFMDRFMSGTVQDERFALATKVKTVTTIGIDRSGNPHDLEKVLDYLTETFYGYVKEGYEGMMVRGNGPYEPGKRSKELLKRKDFIDEEFKITEVTEGNGKWLGFAATVTLETKEGKVFRATIKGTDEEKRHFLEQKESLIGKDATVRFFEYTEDGVPRFPVMYSVRDYE